MRAIEFSILPAPEILKNDVECFRIAKYSGGEALSINVSVSGLPGIVFQHNQGWSPIESIITPSKCKSGVPTLYIYGQITVPSVMKHKKGPYMMTQVILKPQALSTLLGVNAAALTDHSAELDEFAAADLNVQLLDATNEQHRIKLLTNFLVAKREQAKTRDRLVEESLRLIHNHTGSISVPYLLDQLHISERQFERRFSQTVGVSPQFYIRVRRFKQAVALVRTRQFDRLTDVAHTLNFYDESHFIRDVKAFSGITPKSLSQKVGDSHHDQAGYSYI